MENDTHVGYNIKFGDSIVNMAVARDWSITGVGAGVKLLSVTLKEIGKIQTF